MPRSEARMGANLHVDGNTEYRMSTLDTHSGAVPLRNELTHYLSKNEVRR